MLGPENPAQGSFVTKSQATMDDVVKRSLAMGKIGVPQVVTREKEHSLSMRISRAIDLGGELPDHARWAHITAEASVTMEGECVAGKLYDVVLERLRVAFKRMEEEVRGGKGGQLK